MAQYEIWIWVSRLIALLLVAAIITAVILLAIIARYLKRIEENIRKGIN